MTANVLVLDSQVSQREHGRRVGLRTQRLDAQWHELRINIVGLQEARTPKGIFHSEHYQIWSSGGEGPEAARLGCELWCHRTLALATTREHKTLALSDFRVVVQHADARRLFVRFESSALTFTVVVFHVPCLQSAQVGDHRPITRVQQWWEETGQICDRVLQDDLVWYLVDANAPLATAETISFGLMHAEPSNKQGALFEEFLLERQLVVPSTFARYHTGSSETWTHPTGKRMRRDYIMTSPAAAPSTIRTWVQVDHDTTFDHEDHLPLCLHVQAAFEAHAAAPKRIRWDTDRLRDPNAVAAFQAALSTLPLPTWDVNVDEHCRLYETNLLQIARQHFERRDKSRTRPQLTASTLQRIAFKRHLLDCGRAWELMQDQDPVFRSELREVEKEVKARVQQDLGIHYDQLLVRLQQAGDMHNLKLVFQLLTRFGSRRIKNGNKARPLPALRKKDGTLATTFTEQQMIWMEQFSEIEAGVPMHWSELQRLDRPGLGPPRDIHCQELFPSPCFAPALELMNIHLTYGSCKLTYSMALKKYVDK